MRFLIRFLAMAFLLAPLGQIGAQSPCGVCTPKDTTLAALNAFKAKMGIENDLQDARIAGLQASRTRMQKDIKVLSEKVLDLNARPATDTSVVNQLARNSAELARQKAELMKVENELSSLNRQLAEAKANARKEVNKDTQQKVKTGMSNGTKWAIGVGVTAVLGTAVYAISRSKTSITASSSSYSCSGCR